MKALPWQTLVVLFLVSFLAYTNTLGHEFVLDDKIVITNNEFTKKGLDGIGDIFKYDSMRGFFGGKRDLVAGGRYRPLSMASHALEWELVGESPFLYHLNNILIYALSGAMLFLILSFLFPFEGAVYLSFAFLATIFFQLNPLHTEVVANIKSRDELMSWALSLAAILAIIRWMKSKGTLNLIVAAVLFFLALLSKEGVVVMLAIVPLMFYFSDKKYDLAQLKSPVLTLGVATLAYVALRFAIIGGAKTEIARELMNNPFLDVSTGDKMATISFTLLMYLKLLAVPYPLTHDYYPKQIAITSWSDPLVLLSLAIHLALIFIVLRGFKKRNIWSLASAIYLIGIALYSNIVFPIGTFMNERFLFIPVLGSSILLAYLIDRYIRAAGTKYAILGLVALIFGVQTIDRNRAWESDASLALTDIKVSSNSAKCNMSAGFALLDMAEKETRAGKKQKYNKEAITYLERSLEIYPTYSPPILLLGNAYTSLGNYPQGIYFYKACLKGNAQVELALNNLIALGQSATASQDFASSVDAYRAYLQYRETVQVLDLLGEVYGKNLGKLDSAIVYLDRAKTLEPNNADVLQKLGVAYAISGNTQKALPIFEKALEINPDNANLWLNLGYAYHGVGRTEDSERSLQRAYELDPKLKALNN